MQNGHFLRKKGKDLQARWIIIASVCAARVYIRSFEKPVAVSRTARLMSSSPTSSARYFFSVIIIFFFYFDPGGGGGEINRPWLWWCSMVYVLRYGGVAGRTTEGRGSNEIIIIIIQILNSENTTTRRIFFCSISRILYSYIHAVYSAISRT